MRLFASHKHQVEVIEVIVLNILGRGKPREEGAVLGLA